MESEKIIDLLDQLIDLAEPPPNLEPWEWAEKFLKIPPSQASASGPFSTELCPWSKEITEAVKNPQYKRVVTVQGSQTSKTMGFLFVSLAWKMATNPSPVLFYCTSEKLIEKLSFRFREILDVTDELNRRSTAEKNTQFTYYFRNIPVYFLTGNSRSNVSSQSAGMVLFDELGESLNIKGQGNSFHLTGVRGSTFQDFVQLGCGSPALGEITDYVHPKTGLIHWSPDDQVKSLVWKLWQDSTRHEYMLPCPHCERFFTPKLKLIYFDSELSPLEASRSFELKCPHCNQSIDKNKQYQMIKNGLLIAPGQWVESRKRCGQPIEHNQYGSFVSGLCSFWEPWAKRVQSLVAALKDQDEPGHIQSIVNTEFGECFSDDNKAAALDWQVIAEKRQDHWRQGQIPTEDITVLTAFIDVHGLHLDVVVVGWAHDNQILQGYVIQYIVFGGQTFENDVWLDCQKFLQKKIGGLDIRYVGIDAGFNPSKTAVAKSMIASGEKISRNMVLEFARNHRNIFLTKGASHQQSSRYRRTLMDVTMKGKHIKNGLQLWLLDSDFYKTEVQTYLSRDEESQMTRFQFPVDLTDDFFKQATNEVYDYEKRHWVVKGDNHVFDCLAGNIFLADLHHFSEKLPEKPKKIEPKKPFVNRMDNDWGGDFY